MVCDRPSCVVITNPSWRMSILFLVAARFLGANCVVDCQDVFYHMHGGLKGVLTRTVELLMLTLSDGCIFTSSLAQSIHAKSARSSTVVPIGYPDLAPVYPEVFRGAQTRRRPCVTYFGSGWAEDDMPTLLSAYRLFSVKFGHAILRLVGVSSNLGEVLNLVKSLELDGRVEIVNNYKNMSEEMLTMLMESDILVVPAGLGDFVRSTVRFKIYYYLMAGKPIVATDTPAIREIFGDSNAGLLVPPSNPLAFADALSLLALNENLSAEFGRKARDLFLDRYEISKCYPEYVRFCTSCSLSSKGS